MYNPRIGKHDDDEDPKVRLEDPSLLKGNPPTIQIVEDPPLLQDDEELLIPKQLLIIMLPLHALA